MNLVIKNLLSFHVPPPTNGTNPDTDRLAIPTQPFFSLFFRLDTESKPSILNTDTLCEGDPLLPTDKLKHFSKIKTAELNTMVADRENISIRNNIAEIGLAYEKSSLRFFPWTGEHGWNHLSNTMMVLSTLILFLFTFMMMLYTQITLIDGYGVDPVAFFDLFSITKLQLQGRSITTIAMFLIVSIITMCMVYELLVLSIMSRHWRENTNPYYGHGIMSWLSWIAFVGSIITVIVFSFTLGTNPHTTNHKNIDVFLGVNISLGIIMILSMIAFYRLPDHRNKILFCIDLVMIALLGTNIYLRQNRSSA